jgi:ribosomal-protein-alanine N-acetyltransferase
MGSLPAKILSVAPKLRDYTPADFDQLWSLDQSCFADDISYSRSELRMYLSLRTAICIVAEEGGKIIGFIIADSRPSRPAYVVTLDVDPEHRRSGAATAMFCELESRLHRSGVSSIRLEVAVDNQPAITFYGKFGFFEIGRKQGYYGGRVDAISMRKDLTAK